MLNWLWPWAFLLLPLPLILRWLMPPVKQGANAIRVPFYERLAQLADGNRRKTRTPLTPMLLTMLAWIALVTAIARPTWIGEPVTLPQSGRDLMLAIDISVSMREDDMKVGSKYVSRLDAVKAVVSEFIDKRVGDRVGLILFGQQGYLQTPLTFDRDSVSIQLQETLAGFAGNATAIGDALGLGITTLRDRPAESRVLILLTDGANTTGSDPRAAMEIAAEAEIRVHTVGVGADSKMERGFFGRMHKTFPSRDLDEKLLGDIASTTGGEYFRARDPSSMAGIYEEINKLEPVPEEKTYRPIKSLFHWPLLGACLVTLILMASVRWTSTPRSRTS